MTFAAVRRHRRFRCATVIVGSGSASAIALMTAGSLLSTASNARTASTRPSALSSASWKALRPFPLCRLPSLTRAASSFLEQVTAALDTTPSSPLSKRSPRRARSS
jgi:hypothetical protein